LAFAGNDWPPVAFAGSQNPRGAIPGKACTVIKHDRGKQFKIPVHGVRSAIANGMKLGRIGWHTFQHTHRSAGDKKDLITFRKTL
jgi:hypothetical protein